MAGSTGKHLKLNLRQNGNFCFIDSNVSAFYRQCIRPVLFRCDPEKIHSWTLNRLASIARSPAMLDLLHELFAADNLPTTRFGIRFLNPIGLAAGMDKNGIAIPSWQSLGFGFCEIGGVTRHPQPGNPKPRLFRIPESSALINQLGLNNCGADALADTLAKLRRNRKFPLGINLGKSKRTPIEESASDFAYSLKKLWHLADFFVVNVSCPNVRRVRMLQEKQPLQSLLNALAKTNRQLASDNKSVNFPAGKPLLLKIDPDLSQSALEVVVNIAQSIPLAGIVATNTTTRRPVDGGPFPSSYQETGGLSGQPLRKRSTEIIRRITVQTQGKLVIIGVGGICDAESAWEKITAGAHLCQIYSGLVFQGPGLISNIVRGLANQLQCHQMKTLRQAVGSRLPFIQTR